VSKRIAAEETLVALLSAGAAEGIFPAEHSRFTTRVVLGMLSGIVDWYSPVGPLSAVEIGGGYADIALDGASRRDRDANRATGVTCRRSQMELHHVYAWCRRWSGASSAVRLY
jgi:hypothetical protein